MIGGQQADDLQLLVCLILVGSVFHRQDATGREGEFRLSMPVMWF